MSHSALLLLSPGSCNFYQLSRSTLFPILQPRRPSFPLSKLLPHHSCHFVFLWENEKEKQLQWNLESSGQLHWYSRLEFGESEHGNPLLHIGHWYSNAPQDKNNGGIESTWKISPAVTTKHEFSITFLWKQLGQALDNRRRRRVELSKVFAAFSSLPHLDCGAMNVRLIQCCGCAPLETPNVFHITARPPPF